MGGAVGLWLLVNAPHRIGRAVLANTAARFGTPEGWNARIRTILSDGMTGIAEATIERWFSESFAEREANRVEAVRDVLLATDPAGYAACCAALRDMDLREALSSINRPVLVVSGTDDPVVGDDDLALMLARVDGATHVALEAKHIASIEAEAAFNTAVVDFLTAKRPSLTTPAKTVRGRAVPLAPPARAARPARRAASARSPLRKAVRKTGGEPAVIAPKRATAKAAIVAPPTKAPAEKATAKKAAAKASGTRANAPKAARGGMNAKALAKPAPAKPAPASKRASAKTATIKATPTKPATSKMPKTKAAPSKAARTKSVAATNGAKSTRIAKSPSKASPINKAGARKPAAPARKVAGKAPSKAAKPSSKVTKPSVKTTKGSKSTKVSAPARRAPPAKARGPVRRGRP
jgi:hypothetical protein